MKKLMSLGLLSASLTGYMWWNFIFAPVQANWTQNQRQLLDSLSLTKLPDLPVDPSNNVADLEEAAELGHLLYFDSRLSGNSSVSCASCHLSLIHI